MWTSASNKSPTLKWGFESSQYNFSVAAYTTKIKKESMCGAPASTVGFFDLGLSHSASFLDIYSRARGDKIYYIFGDSETENWSQEYVS